MGRLIRAGPNGQSSVWSTVLVMKRSRCRFLLASAALLPVLALGQGVPTDPEEQFKALYGAGDFAAALPYAQESLRTLESDPSRAGELPAAYNRLASVQLQLDDLKGAEANYLRALEFIEANDGISGRRLIEPLTGLGATYAAMDQHAMAVEYLRRAISVSRRNDGLFNLGQLELMEREIASQVALGDQGGVLQEREYAVRIAERNFGKSDPRIVPALRQLAEACEFADAYDEARRAYAWMYEVGQQEGGKSNPTVVDALLGIGRSHRHQFTRDPRSTLDQGVQKDPVTGEMVPIMSLEPYVGPQPHRSGRQAILEAIALLRQVDDPPPELLAKSLIELGDWYATLAQGNRAVPNYVEAWGIHSTALVGEPNPLSAPRLVFFRTPTASRRSPGSVPLETVLLEARFQLEVDALGAPENIVLISTQASPTQTDYLRRALEKAYYSPRIEEGKSVSTPAVEFTAYWEATQESLAAPAKGTP